MDIYTKPRLVKAGFVFIASKRDKDERFMAENGGTRISSRHEEVFRWGNCLLFLG